MPTDIEPFSDEQLRVSANLEQHYDVWKATQQALFALPYGMKWKTVSGREYLYAIADRLGNGRSLGPRSPETEPQFEQYRTEKAALTERATASAAKLDETCRLYRALRLPTITSEAAKILREADRRQLLGSHLLVVGTNAIPAYLLEAGGRFDAVPDETDGFDLAWSFAGDELPAGGRPAPVWAMLKAVDSTFTVNTERPFQARNAKAYAVELLSAASTIASMHRQDQPRPIPLPEQEWLLPGTRISHVVVGRDASPARIVAPDPRWFALQKLWMSAQNKRNPLKRGKDRIQAIALLEAVRDRMPQFPLDRTFEGSLPQELRGFYGTWKEQAGLDGAGSTPSWSTE
ncbi:MAG: GSU2403 family nucleotidyltransferase fold protein [Parvibaculum sp.]